MLGIWAAMRINDGLSLISGGKNIIARPSRAWFFSSIFHVSRYKNGYNRSHDSAKKILVATTMERHPGDSLGGIAAALRLHPAEQPGEPDTDASRGVAFQDATASRQPDGNRHTLAQSSANGYYHSQPHPGLAPDEHPCHAPDALPWQ